MRSPNTTNCVPVNNLQLSIVLYTIVVNDFNFNFNVDFNFHQNILACCIHLITSIVLLVRYYFCPNPVR